MTVEISDVIPGKKFRVNLPGDSSHGKIVMVTPRGILPDDNLSFPGFIEVQPVTEGRDFFLGLVHPSELDYLPTVAVSNGDVVEGDRLRVIDEDSETETFVIFTGKVRGSNSMFAGALEITFDTESDFFDEYPADGLMFPKDLEIP